MNKRSSLLATAMTGAVAMVLSQGALANPFKAEPAGASYQLAQNDTGKSMDGKCGADKAKDKDGKCGSMKDKDGKCGGMKDKDGKCGADKAKSKAKDGKCGEGKCGANKGQ